ncbi:hypothetical protein LPJ73_000480 [Coemansia sp. RSA 2703]|nr:hypothetical protein LPJ73_000480 [Coemansia sp. RSA 2703]KAJ2376741.1 hypothetical protein IW150_001796 [Coemansia sp. RSA 2607]KAJ2397560.1 hypothetical protein GGI05_000580 [Coemansia sp. RSA 2603]
MLHYPMSAYEQHLPPMPTFGRRPSFSQSQVYNTSSYKYAIFDFDNKTSPEIYSPLNTSCDNYSSFRSFLPVFNCCYAVYKLSFVRNMRATNVVIFYTWLPPAASEAEKQRYRANASNVGKQLSHYDIHFECSEWREFQHHNAVAKVCRLMNEVGL